MKRDASVEIVINEIDLADCPAGVVFQPQEGWPDERADRFFRGWETPLMPWDAFRMPSGFEVARDGGETVLAWTPLHLERALVTGPADLRDVHVDASIKPIDAVAPAHSDRLGRDVALVGIAFRIVTSRHYYHFAIEAKRRAVLYRRDDDEWTVLAEQPVAVPDGYVTLTVDTDGDGLRCSCAELGVAFIVTDTRFARGKAGVRGIGRSFARSVRVRQTTAARDRDELYRAAQRREERRRRRGLPPPEWVRTYALPDLVRADPLARPIFRDFVEAGRYDLLVIGETLKALTADGAVLWTSPVRLQAPTSSTPVLSEFLPGEGRLLYGFAGETTAAEMVVIRGRDGVVLARRALPAMAPTLHMPDFSPRPARLSSDEGTDIVLREWDRAYANGGTRLWAWNRQLEPLWEQTVGPAAYGHHDALDFCDVDGDGRDELLAGGVLFDQDGSVLWVHDDMERMVRENHYDAVMIGDVAGDAESDPVAFLCGQGLGVYVVDARTGRTRMRHPIGHAQGRFAGTFRDDMPGRQVLAFSRWGNMGVCSLLSGHGDRLWTAQPDYVVQGSCAVRWGCASRDLIWFNTSAAVQGLYDGFGRRVLALPELSRLWGRHPRREVMAFSARLGTDPRDLLCLGVDGKLHVFGPASSGSLRE